MEIEAKFSVENPQTFDALKEAGALSGRRLRAGEVLRFKDRYFDTADGSLFDQGFALRERSGGDQVVITLKSLGETGRPIHHRTEIETRLDDGRSLDDLKSGAVLKKLNKLIGDTPLVLLVELEQDRHILLLKDGRRIVAEICLDEVTVVNDGRGESYLELEVELRKGGTEGDLIDILEDLQREWQLVPQPRSKYIRALESVGHPLAARPAHGPGILNERPPKVPGIASDDSMVSAAQKTLSLHYRHMCYNEPGTRLGENIEALHDMRVAIRRLRAAFQVFAGYLPVKAGKQLLKGLKSAGRSLGGVRDLDVFWEKTVRFTESLDPGQRVDLSALRSAWEKKHAAARIDLHAYLDSPAYRHLKTGFLDFLDNRENWRTPELFDGASPRPHLLQHVVPVAIYQRLAEVLAYDEWVTGPAVPLERLHDLRIAAKRLRYTMEFFREVLGPEVELLIGRIKGLQDHLGDLQDAGVARDILESFLIWGTWGDRHDQPVGLIHQPVLFRDIGASLYLEARQREIDILVETFPQAWNEIRDPYFAHSIAAMLTVW